MRRLQHDLPGVKHRISKLAIQFEREIEDTQQVWQDSRGRAFFKQYTSELQPMMNQLGSSLSQLIELTDQVRRQLSDPDRESR